jgi:sugar lactone lactonase YvrE
MKTTLRISSISLFLSALLFASPAPADPPRRGDADLLWRASARHSTLTFTTRATLPLGVEGLTADPHGDLYSATRGETSCPVWRFPQAGGAPSVVGYVPDPCSPAGLAFDASGKLYVANLDKIYVLEPSDGAPPTATVFASEVPGANGVAFDRRGNLWVSDGTTGQGRVWKVDRSGVRTEVFRVQPMANDVNSVANVGGIGRDPRSLPPGTVTFSDSGRTASNTLGSQHLVANGIAFTPDGSLFVADTARGAIWKVELGRDGSVRSPVGCDTTFAPNTLCLDDVFVQHPWLEGLDGIALDEAGNIWGVANERNAVVVATPNRQVVEFFRNEPDPTTRLRNAGPLEFPTSPFLAGRTLCITHSDGNRRDNAPNTAGEVGVTDRAKVSCLDQPLPFSGLPLPVR